LGAAQEVSQTSMRRGDSDQARRGMEPLA
jgi:hypothetical protein